MFYLLEICYSFSKSVQVEIITNVFLVDFDKKFMTLKVTEPLNPA